MWINSWFDIEKEKEATNSLIDEGMNAIGYYGGTTAPQAACEEAGCYTNGFTLDYLEYGPDAVVTSFVFNWVPILTEIINRVQNNQWSNETVYYGIKEGACSCSAFNSKTLSADQIAKCETVYESIKNGELDFTKGPIYDNKGNCVLEDGKNFTMNDSLSMGGAYITLAYTTAWTEEMTSGKGWIAAAIVVFALWNPAKAALGSILFGLIEIVDLRLQSMGIPIPSYFLSMCYSFNSEPVLCSIEYHNTKILPYSFFKRMQRTRYYTEC